MSALEVYEGKDVVSTGVAIRNTGHGLEETMRTEPTLLHHGEKVYVLIECDVEKVRYDPVDKDNRGGEQTRVHMLVAGTSTFLDAEQARGAIEKQAIANKERRDREAGQLSIEQESERQLREDHALGEHADGLVDGCSLCASEREAEETEAEA
jgi:hypothetical protein